MPGNTATGDQFFSGLVALDRTIAERWKTFTSNGARKIDARVAD